MVLRYVQADVKHHNDHDIGVAIIDAYTHFILAYLETIIKTSKATLQDFVSLPLTVRIMTNDSSIPTILDLSSPIQEFQRNYHQFHPKIPSSPISLVGSLVLKFRTLARDYHYDMLLLLGEKCHLRLLVGLLRWDLGRTRLDRLRT